MLWYLDGWILASEKLIVFSGYGIYTGTRYLMDPSTILPQKEKKKKKKEIRDGQLNMNSMLPVSMF